MMDILSRRSFLTRSAATAAATGSSLFWTPAAQAQMPRPKASTPLEEKLDAYIDAYMAAMNAPGLTLGLTDKDKTLRTGGWPTLVFALLIQTTQAPVLPIPTTNMGAPSYPGVG